MKNLFQQAHALTRATIQTGDNYQATFTLCLRAIIADAKQAASDPLASQFNTVFDAIGYKSVRKPMIVSDTMDTAIKTAIVVMFIMAIMALFIAVFTGGML